MLPGRHWRGWRIWKPGNLATEGRRAARVPRRGPACATGAGAGSARGRPRGERLAASLHASARTCGRVVCELDLTLRNLDTFLWLHGKDCLILLLISAVSVRSPAPRGLSFARVNSARPSQADELITGRIRDALVHGTAH